MRGAKRGDDVVVGVVVVVVVVVVVAFEETCVFCCARRGVSIGVEMDAARGERWGEVEDVETEERKDVAVGKVVVGE